MAEPLQKKLQGELEKYQQLQKELGRAVAARQKLETQLTENNIVQEELSLLDETNGVFKLLGPVLVRQELEEAKGTVGKRLEYISGEMWVRGERAGIWEKNGKNGKNGKKWRKKRGEMGKKWGENGKKTGGNGKKWGKMGERLE
ncbi:prefoldin subunit 6 [Anomalospiza imberbis]|uniref:prefoldin subunit 6 n=1 Tax=Anomalospiza imberbis TaxID=187417 RepID=UPI0035902949